MDPQRLAEWVAIASAICAGVYAVIRGAILLGIWLQRRTQKDRDFTDTEKKVGILADNSTKAVRELERKLDDRHDQLARKLDEHSEYDHERFDVVTETLGDIQRTLGRIEGRLGPHR